IQLPVWRRADAMLRSTAATARFFAGPTGTTAFMKTGCGVGWRLSNACSIGAMVHSCIYQGHVRHRRYVPTRHSFTASLFLMYVDLAELPDIFARRWLWSVHAPNLAWLRREDHFGAAHTCLDTAVRDLVTTRCGRQPSGPIRLLTHLRYFGY